MIALLSVIAMIVGLLMYALCANPKLAEIGRLTFFAGVLAFLLEAGPRVVALLGGAR